MEPWEIQFFKDSNTMKVFETLLNSPKSAEQISDECNIPRSTVYKKLKDLEEKNLIKTNGALKNGTRIRVYKKRSHEVNE